MSVQNFSFLACLEVPEKFVVVVVVVGGWVVCKPILVFSLSLSQAEQFVLRLHSTIKVHFVLTKSSLCAIVKLVLQRLSKGP